jgi:A/G-specific adenine glycosylase
MKRELLSWYARDGRDFPWRHTTDPYEILVSEVMLQQTQASRVGAYYERWVRRWPTVRRSLPRPPPTRFASGRAWATGGPSTSTEPGGRAGGGAGLADDLTELPGRADRGGRRQPPRLRRPVLPSTSMYVASSSEPAMRSTARVQGAHGSALASLARVRAAERCPLAEMCPSRGNGSNLRASRAVRGLVPPCRAETLRLVADRAYPIGRLDAEAVAALARDGLVSVEQGLVTLPATAPGS